MSHVCRPGDAVLQASFLASSAFVFQHQKLNASVLSLRWGHVSSRRNVGRFSLRLRVWLHLAAVRSAGFAICIASVDWRAMSAKDVQSTAAPVAGGAMPGRQGGSLEAR